MKPITLLVTPDGQWVVENGAEFLTALGDLDADYDASGFAVRNLGFIRFQTFRDSVVEIELHPRNVALPALLAVQQQLLLSRVSLFRIRHLDGSWHSEIMSSAQQAIARLSELCEPHCEPSPTARFSVEPRDYAELLQDERNTLRPLALKWRTSFGRFDPSVISFAIKHQLLSGMMVVGVNPREREPIFRFIGDEHNWLGRSYHVAAIGEKVENQPDKEFGGWVSEFYKSVASSNHPRYDLVTASVQYQEETGKPRRVVRYERLLLPWKTPTDEVFVTLSKLVASKGGSPRFNGENSLAMNVSRPW